MQQPQSLLFLLSTLTLSISCDPGTNLSSSSRELRVTPLESLQDLEISTPIQSRPSYSQSCCTSIETFVSQNPRLCCCTTALVIGGVTVVGMFLELGSHSQESF